MKKIILYITLLLPFSLLGQYSDFGLVNKNIGLVVNSSAYGSGTSQLRAIFDSCGVVDLKFIDHPNIENSTYDGTNDWSSLDLVIIENMGATSGDYTPDVSSAGGLKDVNIIIMEGNYWDDFGLPSITGEHSNDSLKIGYVNSGFHPTSIWKANQGFGTASTSQTYDKFDGASLAASNILLYSINGADSICAYDTLNTKKRMALGVQSWSSLLTTTRTMWSFLARSISFMSGNLAASKKTGLIWAASIATTSDIGKRAVRVKTNLELNGHDIYTPDTADFDSTYVNFNRNGTDSLAWSDIDFVLYGGATSYDSTKFDSLVSRVDRIGIIGTRETNATDLVSKIHIAVKIDTAGTPSGNNIDSLIVTDAGHAAFTGVYSASQKLKMFNSKMKQVKYESIFSGTSVIAKDYGYLTSPDTALIVVRTDIRRWAFPHMIGAVANTYSGSVQAPTDSLWGVFGRLMGWFFASDVLAPSSVNLVDVDIDSFTVSFTDNTGGTAQHAIKLIYPTYNIYGVLAPATDDTSIYYFWPPGQRVVVDIGAISGGDTLWSGAPDTAISRVVIPPTVEVFSLSDTSARFMINGHLAKDTFSDASITSGEVAWTADVGSWGIVTPKKQLRIATDGGTNRLRAAFSADSASHTLDGTDFTLNFRIADSLYRTDQFIEFHFMNMKSSLDSNGYYVRVDSPNVKLFRNDDGTGTAIISSTWTPDSRWHKIKVRRYKAQPYPSFATWAMSLFFDDDSVSTALTASYKKTLFWGIKASDVGMYFDNISIQRQYPGGNHQNVQYAVQDSLRSQYVNHSTKLLQASEDWQTFSTWGSAVGDTIIISTSTPPDTLRLKAKARNVWDD